MICDAHVHMGYYPRIGHDEPYYYSPRRILGILDRCGVDEFAVSSTCSQIEEICISELVREAQEMKRIAGRRAHVFFWLSGHLYDEDPKMSWLDVGIFEGIKLHEDETPWIKERRRDLRSILLVANERRLPVMLHSGLTEGCRPMVLAEVAREFSSVRFNFAHCRPLDEMARVIADCPNVWTDTAYMSLEDFPMLCDYEWHERLMFGTDLPVWQAHEKTALNKLYGDYVRAIKSSGLKDATFTAFKNFIKSMR